MGSEEEEVALLCLLICDDGKRREKRKRKDWVRNIFWKQNELEAFSTLVNGMRLGDKEYYFKKEYIKFLSYNLQ